MHLVAFTDGVNLCSVDRHRKNIGEIMNVNDRVKTPVGVGRVQGQDNITGHIIVRVPWVEGMDLADRYGSKGKPPVLSGLFGFLPNRVVLIDDGHPIVKSKKVRDEPDERGENLTALARRMVQDGSTDDEVVEYAEAMPQFAGSVIKARIRMRGILRIIRKEVGTK